MMQGPPSLKRVSVIGAGLIGSGVAASAVAAGYEVTLYDINPSLAAIGLERAKEDLAKLLNLGRVSRECEAPLLKISSAVTPDDFNNVDLVIEAVTESESAPEEGRDSGHDHIDYVDYSTRLVY